MADDGPTRRRFVRDVWPGRAFVVLQLDTALAQARRHNRVARPTRRRGSRHRRADGTGASMNG